MVKGAETLVPHLFQFLVMLAYDSSKLVSVPQVSESTVCVVQHGTTVTVFPLLGHAEV